MRNPRTNISRSEMPTMPHRPSPALAPGRGSNRRRIWIALLAAAAAIPLLFGIWVIIRDKTRQRSRPLPSAGGRDGQSRSMTKAGR